MFVPWMAMLVRKDEKQPAHFTLRQSVSNAMSCFGRNVESPSKILSRVSKLA